MLLNYDVYICIAPLANKHNIYHRDVFKSSSPLSFFVSTLHINCVMFGWSCIFLLRWQCGALAPGWMLSYKWPTNSFPWITYSGPLGIALTLMHGYLTPQWIKSEQWKMLNKSPSHNWGHFFAPSFEYDRFCMNFQGHLCSELSLISEPFTLGRDKQCFTIPPSRVCTYHHLQGLLFSYPRVVGGHLSERLLQRLCQQHHWSHHGNYTKHQTAVEPGRDEVDKIVQSFSFGRTLWPYKCDTFILDSWVKH